ncbi:MAG: ABC transporter substrate-binding protein [Acidimicrobiia bacterium]|nr:ABC transporter substrate-binding protein [Acidimicrobiia bacterium]
MIVNPPRKNTFRTLAVSALSLAALVLFSAGCGDSGASVGSEPVAAADTATTAPTTTAPTTTDAPQGSASQGSEPQASTSQAATPGSTPVATDRSEASTGDDPVLPVTVTDETGAEVTVNSVKRIIPLDGDVAEVVFALGLGDNVVATDLSATYPPEADALPEIGYQRALSAETVAAFAPTVLLATDTAGPPGALDDLRRLGYPLIILPNDAAPTGAGQKIRAVAAALGVPQRGALLADALDAAIDEAAAGPREPEDRPRVVALYVRGTSAQLVLGESFNTRWLIDAAGGVDISESMGIDDSAPISAEAILAAAPDVILVPRAGLESVGGVEGLVEIGGLGQTPAGLNRQVLAYDDQLLLGNGPRTAQLLAALRDDLASVTPATADPIKP